jgi:hypothetical protein
MNGDAPEPPQHSAAAATRAMLAGSDLNAFGLSTFMNGLTTEAHGCPVGGTRLVNELRAKCMEQYHLLKLKAQHQRLTQLEELLVEGYLEGCQVLPQRDMLKPPQPDMPFASPCPGTRCVLALVTLRL